MTLAFGLACFLVCGLSCYDKPARPFAFVLLAGWIAGFCPWQLWPLVSLASASALFWLHLHRTTSWSAWVASLAGVMLLADVIYLWFRWQKIPVEVEYAEALDLGLICQLGLVGYRGGINAWLRLWDWGFRGVCGPRLRHRSRRY